MAAGNHEARAPRNRPARWVALLLALATGAGTAACAGPPDKGDVRSAALNQSRNNVVILAREPTPDMSPTLLVNLFLQALTGDQEDPTFSVAQEFLTPGARGRWFPAGQTWSTTTKVMNYTVTTVPPPGSGHAAEPATTTASKPGAKPAVGATETVAVKGTEFAEVNDLGFFKYASGPAAQEFTLKYLGATTGWRIDTPPAFRPITPDAFKRAYQTYQSALPVYLPSHGNPVPQMDQVYLTQATGKVDYTYDALARAVLGGRLKSQHTGLKLAKPVTVDSSGVAEVMLDAAPTGGLDISDIQRALLMTFRDASQTQQLVSPVPLADIEVTYPGCGSACAPVAVSGETLLLPTVYWVCPQGQNGASAAIVSRQLPGPPNAPAVCPANGAKVSSPVVSLSGIHLQKNSPIAVKQSSDSANVKSPSPTTVVAAVQDDGSVVVVNDKNSDQQVWYTAPDPRKVTDLEWDPVDGSLWVVDDNALYWVQDPGDKEAGDTQHFVAVPGGPVTRFKPSPDGLRAVAVGPSRTDGSGTPGTAPPATMVTVSRTLGTPSLSADGDFPLLAGAKQSGFSQSVDLQKVSDAAWADGRTVVLLGLQTGSTTPKLYKVYMDGSQDSSIVDPEDAQPAAEHVAAVMSVTNGHPSLWTVSDAPGPTDPTKTDSYFKRSGGSDSFQEVGSSPVMATTIQG